jgi:hypothetical protein
MTDEFYYRVVVRNELTGETSTVVIAAPCAADAQVEALSILFQSLRWRNAVASVPEVVAPGQRTEVCAVAGGQIGAD